MADFTAADVKALREKTGCGMMDCKKALTETGGDMLKATDFLREKGRHGGKKDNEKKQRKRNRKEDRHKQKERGK